MVLLILPNNRADRYSAIKRHASVKMGLPSQCVLSRTLFKKQRLMSVATKVAIQMNCKLGGEPWNVAIPIKNAMVIGYDAYHDKATRGASYGAVISSINQAWTRYLSQVGRHTNQEELTDNFASGVKNALNHYKAENGIQPAMVVVYRDGVGEGQLEYVKEHEIAA
ncbi:piwi-like protein 1, partial [Penaeus japonicus]|uniref:piwi-like protein 1 n=1 Tax=Penaeus japonicus TaxID=27405 RepID=UPI001C70C9BC